MFCLSPVVLAAAVYCVLHNLNRAQLTPPCRRSAETARRGAGRQQGQHVPARAAQAAAWGGAAAARMMVAAKPC